MILFASVQVVVLVSLLFRTTVGDFVGAALVCSLPSSVLSMDTLSDRESDSEGEGGVAVVAASVEHDDSDTTKDATDNDDATAAVADE